MYKEIEINKDIYKVFGKIFFTLGLLLLITGLVLFFSIKNKISTYIETEGTVTSNIECEEQSVKPVILFTTRDNITIEFSPSQCSSPPSFSEGEKVRVLYPESDPYKAKVGTNEFLYSGLLVLGIFCFGFITIGSFVLFLKGKKEITGEPAARIVMFFFVFGGVALFLVSNIFKPSSKPVIPALGFMLFGILTYIWERVRPKNPEIKD